MKKVVRTPDFPIVKTRLGKLHGFLQDEVFHFHGIRYGTAERFQLPEMERPWEGVRDAKSYGYICPLMPDGMQAQASVVHDPADRNNPMAPPFASFEMPHVYWPMSEDCLYMNIWTKHLEADAKRPVILWLHGGGFGAGSSIELPAYDGHNFVDYGDVVFVSINHRLNCIGFLDLSGFGDKYKYSGCCGMADVVLALKWIKDNIEFFGGDPENVTVAGQSGGGKKASMLLQMPPADGLYHKVISQSGALMIRPGQTLEKEKEYWQAVGNETAKQLGLNAENIDNILNVSYEELSQAAARAGEKLGRPAGMMMLEPSPVEGLYDGPYYIAGFRKETAHIPCMAGTVLGEFNFMHYLGDKSGYSEEDKKQILSETYGEDANRILELFRQIYPDKDILYALGVDPMFRPGTINFLNARTDFLKKNESTAGCWNYMFNLVIPYLGGITLFHCADIAFVFRNVENELLLCTAYEHAEKLQEKMSNAWLSFMKNGDPSTEDLLWQEYSSETKARMCFDETCSVCGTDDKELLELIGKHSFFF